MTPIGLGLGARSALGYGLGVSAPGGAVRNGLLANLVAYWALDEASGNALDKHSNSLTLTDTNLVTSDTGKVYPTARKFTESNAEFFTRPGDDALLSTGDVDFTLACWIKHTNLSATGPGLLGKFGGAGAREYTITLQSAPTSKYMFYVSTNGTAVVTREATTHGAVSAGVWYFAVAWHDSVANTLNIQIDNGTVDSVAHSGGVYDGTQAFYIGRASNSYLNGVIGPAMMWKSTAGNGGVLTASQRSALYANGNGLAYANFTT